MPIKFMSKIHYFLSSLFYKVWLKRWYKIRLLKRFLKYEYRGPWDVKDILLQYSFEILCEFYENNTHLGMGNFKALKFKENAEEEIIKLRKILEKNYDKLTNLYNWWTKAIIEDRAIIDTLKEGANETFRKVSERLEQHQELTPNMKLPLEDEKMLSNLEKMVSTLEGLNIKYYKNGQKNLVELMKLREFLSHE